MIPLLLSLHLVSVYLSHCCLYTFGLSGGCGHVGRERPKGERKGENADGRFLPMVIFLGGKDFRFEDVAQGKSQKVVQYAHQMNINMQTIVKLWKTHNITFCQTLLITVSYQTVCGNSCFISNLYYIYGPTLQVVYLTIFSSIYGSFRIYCCSWTGVQQYKNIPGQEYIYTGLHKINVFEDKWQKTKREGKEQIYKTR